MKNLRKILIYSVNALLLILIGICILRANNYSKLLLTQQAADFWAGDSQERFAQVSCFFPVNSSVNNETVLSFRKTIDTKLTDAGVKPKEEGESWVDCYSATSSLSVEGDRNSSEVTAIGVGGNFFLFHPYQLISGSFISENDLMKDRVVLDYELAWKLFGGTQLEGMTVKIGGTPYYVAGVVRRETDKFSKKALAAEPLMFLSYSTLAALKEGTGISCYEIAMPDPISNYAKNFAGEGFKSQKATVLENSARYNISSIYSIFKNFGNRSLVTSGAIYPYWENAARVSEVYIARLYVIILLLAVFPFICLVMLAVRLIKFLVAKGKKLKFEVVDAWDDRYARQEIWKERRAQKRRAKNLKQHHKKAKPKLKAPEKAQENQPELPKDTDEKELSLDIENIVREIMEDIEGADTKI